MSANLLKDKLGRFFRPQTAARPFDLLIFPLNAVLFPGGLLPLTVVEPHYLEMAEACLREHTPFGVCLAREGAGAGETADTGCIAEIAGSDRGENGELHLTIRGGERFHILGRNVRENGVAVASAVAITPEPSQLLPPQHQTCADVLRRIVEQVGADRFAPPLRYDDAVWVGYRLAEVLPLKLPARQAMLEMNDTLARLEILHRFLVQQGLTR